MAMAEQAVLVICFRTDKIGSKSYNILDEIVKLTKAVCMDMASAMTERFFDTTVRKIKSAERGCPLTEVHRILSTNHPWCPELVGS
jgi:hypothetical protein